MKRIMAVAVVVAFLVTAFAGAAVAANNHQTYIIKNTTGGYVTTVIPQVAIGARHKVFGWDIMGNSTASENVIAVYDETVGRLSGECLGESEAQAASTAGKWIPDGRIIVYGVTVRQGPNTTAFIYFE